MREADWLTIREALHIMLEHVSVLPAEQVPLDVAGGRTLAEPIISPVDHPPWDNSAMDGYAVRSADVAGASASSPVELSVLEEVAAGEQPRLAIGAGQATRIMTGAPIPAGADGVIRVEHTHAAGPGRVAIVSGEDAGRNIRFRGEDLRAGETVLGAGRVLRPAEVGVLAMTGHTQPSVRRRPRVAVLATGSELVDAERIADVLAGTHIINSNTPALAAALAAAGCTAVSLGIARDDLDDLQERLRGALATDALITTAGASVGDHDLVKPALEALGCRTLFWRVRIRPGSPFSFGIIDRDDAPPVPVFGLPGNPVSALVTFEILVRPVLRRMLGRAHVYPFVDVVRTGEEIRSPAGLVRFLRVRLSRGADGMRMAYLTGPQGSGILTSVAAADALLVVPIDVTSIAAGAPAQVVPLGTDDDALDTLELP